MFALARSVFCAALLASAPVPSPSFCTALVASEHTKWAWKDCGDPSLPVQITDVRLSSDVPKPGEYLTIDVSGTVLANIKEDAYAHVTLLMAEFEYINREYPLCNNAHFNLSCPLHAGDHIVTNSITIPSMMPVAPYLARIHAFTADDEELGCLEIMAMLSDSE